MQNIFRCLRILLIFLTLVLGLLPVSLASAEGSVTVSVSVPGQVNPGEQFTVEIVVTPEVAIAGMQFGLSFDSSLVTVDSVVEGDLLSQGGAATYFSSGTIDNVAGTIHGVAGAITVPGEVVSTPGTFATVTFTAGTQGGTSPLTLSGVIVGDIDGQPVTVNVVSGQVSVEPPSGITGGGGGGGSSGSPQDEKAPELSDILVSDITANSVYVTWTTDEKSTSQVAYRADSGNFSPLGETLVNYHRVHLTDLTSATTYYYRVMSNDEAGNLAISAENVFTTTATPAIFTVNMLDITPAEVSTGEEVTISFVVTNSGDIASSYMVTMTLNSGNSTETKQQSVYLAGGASQEVTFTEVANIAGTSSVDVNGLSGSFIVKEKDPVKEAFVLEEAPGFELENLLLSITPNYESETGTLVSTGVTCRLNRYEESMAGAELILKVSFNDAALEEVPIILSSQTVLDGTGSIDYIPLQGWKSGKYTFQAILYAGGEVIESTAEKSLEVTPESAVKVVNWSILGLIIGSSLLSIAIIVAIVIYRRRDMLKNHV